MEVHRALLSLYVSNSAFRAPQKKRMVPIMVTVQWFGVLIIMETRRWE